MNTENLKFSKEHEWVNIKDGKAYIGISDFAQNSLGDIVFVDLPSPDSDIETGKVFASVESVKAVSDIFSPFAGKIIEVNENLSDQPQLLNENPYESWIALAEINDKSELDALMSAEEYKEYCKGC